MKSKNFATFIILFLILILFAATTPDRQEHLFEAEQQFRAALEDVAESRTPDSSSNDHWLARFSKKLTELDTVARGALASLEIQSILDEATYRNYLFFSMTTLDGKVLSTGFLNQIIVSEATIHNQLESFF